MTSTPAANSSSAIFGVMPRPPAAFSPLTTTNVGAWRSRSTGSSPSSVRLPSEPTTSPTKRMVAGASGTPHTLTRGMADEVDTPPAPPAPAPVARRPSSSRAGCSSSCSRSGVLALYALAHAAGIVLLLFIVAARHRADPQPGRRAAAAHAAAADALRSSSSTSRSSRSMPGVGFLLADPVADQATSFAGDVPGLVDDANASLDDVQTFFDDKGIDVQIKGQSDSALASLQDSIVSGSGEIVSVTGELLRTLVELSLLRDPRHRPVDLHAHLRAADRRARALGHAAGRRDAGGRLPDAGAARGRRLRPRPAAVQRDHGDERRGRAVALRRPRDLPRRAHVRAGVRRLLRAHGARPVRRARARRAAADPRRARAGPADRASGSRCCSSRCSSSRATSSRRTSSATRCA